MFASLNRFRENLKQIFSIIEFTYGAQYFKGIVIPL
jgi:hypothetical protein